MPGNNAKPNSAVKQLEKAFEQLKILQNDIPARESVLTKFEKYMQEVLVWNKKVNLTSITDKNEFVKKHFIDSLLCINAPEFADAQKVIDVGTGSGFPGVPLAIICPDKKFTLVDSLNKRIKIVRELCKKIGIENIEAIHGRAEELASKNSIYREAFDVCVSRAVANMTTLSEYCLPFVKKGGYAVMYKGPDSDAEIKEAEKAIKILGGEIDRIDAVCPEGLDLDHKLVFIAKINNSPVKYPRKAGIPAKKPIR